MKKPALACLLLLSACAAPEPVFKPVTVTMPVTVPCKIPPLSPPPSALAQLPPTASLFAKTQAALVEIDQRKAFEADMQAALQSCL